MRHRARRSRAVSWLAPLLLAAGVYSCGSSGGAGEGGNAAGATCSANGDCASGACSGGVCVGNGVGAPAGSACDNNGQCASGICDSGSCGAGTDLPDGTSCGSADECASGQCSNGVCGGPSTGSGGSGSTGPGTPGADCTLGSDCMSGLCVSGKCSTGPGTGTPGGTSTTTGPHFGGTGKGFRPLTTGCGPDTADQCTGECEAMGGDPTVTVVRPPATLCFAGEGDLTPDDPAVVIEQVIESVNGVEYVHIRVTFDPAFTDNTFGEGSCCGWSPMRGHRFSDLTGSDHTELLLTNGDTETVMHFKVDLITADPNSPCGYGTLGVEGGDGEMIVGSAEHVLAVATSLDRNLGGCGYCTSDACAPSGDCTVDSPTTDEMYTPNAATSNWDYRQVYEVWIAMDAFEPSGFGQAYITYTHSSPSKGQDTIMVDSTPCPPEWDRPYCPPSVIQEGGNCFGSGGSGGGSGTGGSTGSGGSGGGCPPNYQVYITSEGASICTPIPFVNYDGMKPCPDGYVLDLASEGQFCVPAT